jgi:hypothetical protein
VLLAGQCISGDRIFPDVSHQDCECRTAAHASGDAARGKRADAQPVLGITGACANLTIFPLPRSTDPTGSWPALNLVFTDVGSSLICQVIAG